MARRDESRARGDGLPIRDGANLVVLRTFSKAHGLAGLRIGYALTRPEHAHALERVREAFNTSSLAQAAALAAIEDTAHVERTREVVFTVYGDGRKISRTVKGGAAEVRQAIEFADRIDRLACLVTRSPEVEPRVRGDVQPPV